MNRRSIVAAECLLVIPYRAVLLHLSSKLLILFGGKTYLRADIGLEKMFTIAVSKHADERVVDLDEAPIGRREKHPFLNIVEEFPIASFRFASVGDVLQHVNGLKTLAVCPVNPRGGHKIGPVQNGENIFVGGRIRS